MFPTIYIYIIASNFNLVYINILEQFLNILKRIIIYNMKSYIDLQNIFIITFINLQSGNKELVAFIHFFKVSVDELINERHFRYNNLSVKVFTLQ